MTRLDRIALVLVLAALVLAIVYTVAQSYSGRVQLREAGVRSCERVTADRWQEVLVYRAAARRERLLARDDAPTPAIRTAHRRSARAIATAARDVSTRTARSPRGRAAFCARAYPRPSFSPLGALAP